MTQWNMRSMATLRMADALLRTVGGGEVALRFPKPAQAGSDAEQLGLSAPAFEDVPIKPAIFRRIYGKPSGAKQGGNDTARYELLLSATAVALQMTALNIGTVAERVETRSLEFGKLVQEQNPVVGERCLAGPGRRSAADQPGSRNRVVRGSERTRANQAAGVEAGHAVDPGHLERLAPAHCGQNRRKAPRQHRLAGAWRSLEQQVVSPRSGDLQREQRRGVTAYVDQVVIR